MVGSVSSRFSRRLGSTAFAREAATRGRLRHWLASAPLIAVAVFTINGTAPAEINTEQPAPAIVEEQGRWSIDNARALLRAVEESATEGLNPADYQVDALRDAVTLDHSGAELDRIANASALKLAHDYANGRIDDKKALDWHFAPDLDASELDLALTRAIATGQVDSWLRGLLPDNPQYRALKAAYATTPAANVAARDQLRANLERWRWMPRSLGDRYIYVNIPAYRLQLVENGVEQASHDVIVGAPKTPTPQLLLHAQSVVANPSWTVPESIARAGKLRGTGFTAIRFPDGKVRMRQAPGPTNALGRVKIDMPNPMAIYLHDTPNRAAFGREKRALSHGCVRVANIEELAGQLRGGADVEEALAHPTSTKVLQLEKSVPVYIVYFTAQADGDGVVTLLDDPYGRDQALVRQLGGPGSGAMVMAARSSPKPRPLTALAMNRVEKTLSHDSFRNNRSLLE